jgi:hypothetical protein
MAHPQAGTDCLIGTEIVTYKQVNASAPFGLTGVTRGAYGTQAAAHPAGANVSLLLQIYGGFSPGLGRIVAFRCSSSALYQIR